MFSLIVSPPKFGATAIPLRNIIPLASKPVESNAVAERLPPLSPNSMLAISRSVSIGVNCCRVATLLLSWKNQLVQSNSAETNV